jgi:4-diphosphocytidyl-2-C-methyl-D-erythritol kinase
LPATARLAPAKLNLALHVTGSRADGFHLLESLVVFTRFGDRVEIAEAEADGFAVEGPFAKDVPADASNLVLRARDRLRVLSETTAPSGPLHHASHGPPPPLRRGGSEGAAGLDLDPPPFTGEGDRRRRWKGLVAPPVSMRLTKNLPVASGVGGGSSDAAATLKALAELWGIETAALESVATELGADVPMCLAGSPLIAKGIGHETTTLPDFPPLPLVLINPGVAVSTPNVFRALTSRENPPMPPLPSAPDFAALVEWLGKTRNDLQAPAMQIAPGIGEALTAMTDTGAAFARMSGSGATCFGLFERVEDAEKAAAAMRRMQPGWFVVSTLSTASGETFDGETR